MKLMLRNVPNLVTNVKMMVMEEMINAKMRLKKISARKSKSLAVRVKLMLRNVPRVAINVKMMMEEMMTEEMMTAKTRNQLSGVIRKREKENATKRMWLKIARRLVTNVMMSLNLARISNLLNGVIRKWQKANVTKRV